MQLDATDRMSDICSFNAGDSPLIISIPHDGRELMPGQAQRMTEAGRSIPDTDWHLRRLYEFAEALDASLITARFSRYVVDLNRSPEDDALYAGRISTGLCPTKTFAGERIYEPGVGITDGEKAKRVSEYWQPYHETLRIVLEATREKHGYALLWDAHSIAGEVPMLFEGVLPDLNIGTDNGKSCGSDLAAAVSQVAEGSAYTAVTNGRFRGGYITRRYGRPEAGVHAIQLELAQRTYMDETNAEYEADRAAAVAGTIRQMLVAYQESVG